MTKYYSLLQIWKTIKWDIPAYMSDKLTKMEDNKIETDLPRIHLTSNAYRNSTARHWNNLPDHLREETSISRFKLGLKKWLRQGMEEMNRPPDSTP